MKHFVYFSKSAVTSGNAMSMSEGNLMKAGRVDIAIHTVIQGLFLSHGFRKDVMMHLVFYGPPDPPKHIEIQVAPELDISKKDIGNLIKKILYKHKEGKKTEVFPGCFVEKKSLFGVVEGLYESGNGIFVLDRKGEDIRKAEIPGDCAFVLGDHEGLPKKELRALRKIANSVSIGSETYFASQVVAVVNNELDRRFS